MSIRYRLKRNSGPVHQPIPAHPDAIYRPQNRLTPTHAPSAAAPAAVIAPRVMSHNPVMAAPHAAGGGGGFSPWWIIGPLLALLAALALAALAYMMKKKHDSKKQAEGENDPGKREIKDKKTNENKEEKPEGDDSAKRLPVENLQLRSMKPTKISDGQKQTAPISSPAKGNSKSDTGPLSSKNVNKEPSGKATPPIHGLPLTNDRSTLPSTHANSSPSSSHPPNKSAQQAVPINVTRMTKPNSDESKKPDEKTPIDPLLISPLKNIRSVSADKTEPNYPGSLPLKTNINPTSLGNLPMQKLGQPTDKSDLNTSKPKSDGNTTRAENPQNKKTHDGQPSSDVKDGKSTNLGRADHTEPLKPGQGNKEFPSSSSPSPTNDLNPSNKSGGGHMHQPNSPEEHGVGKSPLISTIPTGARRSEKEKLPNRTDQANEGKTSSKPLSSSLSTQKQNSPKGSTHSNQSKDPHSSSDINKNKQQSTLTVDSKRNPISESKEKAASTSVTSAEPTKEKNAKLFSPNEKLYKQVVQPSEMINKNDPDKLDSRHSPSSTPPDHASSNRQPSKNPNDDKSDESTTSSTRPGSKNHGKAMSLMPNVPQCKGNASSDDNDYDELYPVSTNDSTIPQTSSKRQKSNKPNSNMNINASTTRKKRPLLIHRPAPKRFHSKDKL